MNIWQPIETIAQTVRDKKGRAEDYVRQALETAEKNEQYNALIVLDGARAVQRAKEIDAKPRDLPLAGVPFIAKDNFLTLSVPTTASSNMLRDFQAPYQSTAIERLEAAGAILIGKANLDAFAHGSTTENSDFGPTKNPHDETKVPGGSSGGSAAAIALNIAPFALGTDTGGSIRLPASFCGVVGLKPTYGLVSRFGVVAMASSTDCIGPLTRSVADAAQVLNVMAGPDKWDGTTIQREDDYLPKGTSLEGKRFGVISEFMASGLKDDVREAITRQINIIKERGGTVVDVSIASIPLALACYYIIVPAEISSNLSRYDGLRFGHRGEGESIDEVIAQSRSEGFNAENKRRILIGTYVLSSGYYDAYYKKAQTVRAKLIHEFNSAFEKVDFLIGPVAASSAFPFGSFDHDPVGMYLSDIMTVAANLVGNPSISIPCATDSMPIGLQLMAPQRQDKNLLEVAQSLEIGR